MPRVEASGLSDIGRVRTRNEDAFGLDPERSFYVVADGMGGHGNGEVASRVAVDAFEGHLRSQLEHGSDPVELLTAAIQYAHARVLRAVEEDGNLVGMGTTIVGALVREGKMWVAHVGDSRAYRLRKGQFELLTDDHTWVNQQVAAGYMSEEQARVHPLKNVVTRALGGETQVEVETDEIDLEEGDLYVLCSDGLSAMLHDDEIGDLLRQRNEPLGATCQQLVDRANRRGGVDNVTVVLLEIGPE